MNLRFPNTVAGRLAWAGLFFIALFGLAFLLLATRVFGGFGPCGGSGPAMICLLLLFVSLPIAAILLLAAGIVWKVKHRSNQEPAVS